MSARIEEAQQQRRAGSSASATSGQSAPVVTVAASPSIEANYGRLRAPFSLRCGALLLDYTIVVSILAFATILSRVVGNGARWTSATILTLGYIAAPTVAILNFVVLAALGGRTLGKWITGLHIER